MKTVLLTTNSGNCVPQVGSFTSLGIGETVVLNYENGEGRTSDEVLKHKPDLVIMIASMAPYILPDEVYYQIRSEVPLVQILGDGRDIEWHRKTVIWRDAFTLIVNIDGVTDWPHRKTDMTTLTPIDTRPYTSLPAPTRDIQLGYPGVISTGSRKHTLEALLDAGVLTHYHDPGSFDRSAGGDYQVYADFLRRSRFVINHAGDQLQMNGRIIECGTAGACLLADDNELMRKWFKPYEHYIPYRSPEEVIEIVRSIGKDESDRVAACMSEYIDKNHSPRIFWGAVISRLKEMGYDLTVG